VRAVKQPIVRYRFDADAERVEPGLVEAE
jgi:hypothetical protein